MPISRSIRFEEVAVRNKFGDMLDRMTEVSDADQMPIEARMERLERIVQTILLALVEERKPREEEDDRPH